MRVVLDTDVILAGILSATGASRQVFLKTIEGDMTGLISVPLLMEYEAMLKRPQHLKRAYATIGDIDVILDRIAATFCPVIIYYSWRPFLRDANDDMVLEAAVNGESDMIVTFNLKDFDHVKSKFGIEVLNPGTILRRQKWK